MVNGRKRNGQRADFAHQQCGYGNNQRIARWGIHLTRGECRDCALMIPLVRFGMAEMMQRLELSHRQDEKEQCQQPARDERSVAQRLTLLSFWLVHGDHANSAESVHSSNR